MRKQDYYIIAAAVSFIFNMQAAAGQSMPVEKSNAARRVRLSNATKVPATKLPDTIVIEDKRYGQLKIDQNSLKEKALKKTHELMDYINIIINPKTSVSDKNISIDQACLLFNNGDAKVEVSSIVPGKRNIIEVYKIKGYLTALKAHRDFNRISIDYIDITYVSPFQKSTDGYYSAVSFCQRFVGYNDDILSYSDLTKKNVLVLLKPYFKTDNNGEQQANWDVFLSDIGVVETVAANSNKFNH